MKDFCTLLYRKLKPKISKNDNIFLSYNKLHLFHRKMYIYIYIFFLQLQMNKKRVYINPLVALISLCLLGLLVALLNLSALAIMRMPVKRKYFSYPLLWLTASNVLIGIFPLPLYGLKKYNFESSAVASIICDAWRYSYFVTSHISMITLVVMTL